MEERIRAFDWSQTPLGPIEQWPVAFSSTLDRCFTKPDSMDLFDACEESTRLSAPGKPAQGRAEADDRVAAGEARLRAIVNQATATVAQTDLTGRFEFVNQRFCDVLGYAESELLAMRLEDVTDPDDLPRTLALFHRLVQGGPGFVIEKRYRRKDGTPVWMSVSVGGVREGHELRSILGVGLDISDRKRQEAQLLIVNRRQQWLYELANAVNRAEPPARLYEQALQAMAESLSADRASILLIDGGGVMRFHASQGLSSEYRRAVEGHSPWPADQTSPLPLCIDDVASGDFAPELLATIRREGIQALAFIPLTYRSRLLGKFMVYFDRPRRVTEAELEWSHALATTLALAIARTQADENLRGSEERLRLAMAAGRMGAWDLNLQTEATTWDAKQCELFGRQTGHPINHQKEFYEAVHPDDVARVRTAAQRAQETGLFKAEFRVVHPDGAVHWLAGEGAAVTDEQGRPMRMIGINYDITERKQAEAELQRCAAELEHRVAGRTRELTQSREQLRALATELNLAGQRERQHVATELHDYLSQLLALSQIRLAQAMQYPMVPALNRTLCDLQQVTDQALTYTRTLVAQLSPPILKEFGLPLALRWLAEQMLQRELRVALDVCPTPLSLPEDQAMLLFQSVRELLMNVLKHAGAPEAAITILVQDGQLQITVRDQGVGFAHAEQAALPGHGAVPGFGLFSIRERMLALGGRLDLTSQPGLGTTATLVMPLLDQQEPSDPLPEVRAPVTPASTRAPDGQPPQETGRIRVLIADDHAMVRQGLCGLLDGYQDIHVTGEAGNGREAVALATQLRPDVVLMDVTMPGMDGIEATRLIKEILPDTIVIGLSVQNAPHVGLAMREAGALAFLNKDVAVEDLYHTIATARTPS
ncbi:MAG: PAS domain S-box protein [Nitrospira sp.]|nr:PAS domain S-box protein [Nitrospira sp.]